MLVYQAGIANVFQVDCFNMHPTGRKQSRLMQADYHSCQHFAKGLGQAGCCVRSAHCNQAGDISEHIWDDDMETALFNPTDLRIN